MNKIDTDILPPPLDTTSCAVIMWIIKLGYTPVFIHNRQNSHPNIPAGYSSVFIQLDGINIGLNIWDNRIQVLRSYLRNLDSVVEHCSGVESNPPTIYTWSPVIEARNILGEIEMVDPECFTKLEAHLMASQ